MLPRIALFLSSFSPLFALLGLRFSEFRLAMSMYGIAAAGVLSLLGLLLQLKRKAPNPRQLREVRDEGQQVAGYLASYLLPFLAISQPTERDLGAYGGFILVFAVIFVRTDLLQVNPLLYLFGYRIFSAVDALTQDPLYLLTRGFGPAPSAGLLNVSDVAGNLMLVRP